MSILVGDLNERRLGIRVRHALRFQTARGASEARREGDDLAHVGKANVGLGRHTHESDNEGRGEEEGDKAQTYTLHDAWVHQAAAWSWGGHFVGRVWVGQICNERR